jgi:RNA chaperone Hfq
MPADETPAPRRTLGLARPKLEAAPLPAREPTREVAREAPRDPASPRGLESPPAARHSDPDEGLGPAPAPNPPGATGRKNKTGAGMADSKQNLQDAFLNHVRKTKVPVTIFLINGVKLQGVITWFDSFCVLLRRDGQSQLVYKSAISTIMPAQPINLYDGDD